MNLASVHSKFPLCVPLQVRKEQQVLRAGGDRLWRSVSDLQMGLDELKSEQATMRQRMSRIFHRASSLSELRAAEPSLRTLRVRPAPALTALLTAQQGGRGVTSASMLKMLATSASSPSDVGSDSPSAAARQSFPECEMW